MDIVTIIPIRPRFKPIRFSLWVFAFPRILARELRTLPNLLNANLHIKLVRYQCFLCR